MTSDLFTFSLYSSPKIHAVEITLQKTMTCLKDLFEDYDRLSKENMDYKTKFLTLEEKCNCESSSSQESLKKEIDQKNDVIQQITSALTKLLETKDFKVIDEIFKIICGESKLLNSGSPQKETPKKIIQDQSVSEIEETPGRKSPILALSKKVRNDTICGLNLNKKKRQKSRGTPEKSMGLIFPSPSRSKGNCRLKQSRLNVLKEKSSVVVDLTCSPEAVKTDDESNVKKELDYGETILPSPTSGPVYLPQVFKSITKDSSSKFKKPLSPSKLKTEEPHQDWNGNSSETYTQHSIDLMKHCRRNLKLNKSEKQDENMECNSNESVSLLENNKHCTQKAPLCENNTLLNTQVNMESSLSILQRNVKISPPQMILAKRTKLETVESVYKEPTVRKKSDKRALPGWSCDECKQFYGTLYADNLDLLAHKMDECSKHRGRNNPIRPPTPKGFWDPRWDVPTDTEEFNRRNDAA